MTLDRSSAAQPTGISELLIGDHANLVISASRTENVEKFYGGVLGLKQLSESTLPDQTRLLRYPAGKSQLQFLVSPRAEQLERMAGGVSTARGIRLMAFLLPDAARAPISERFVSGGLPEPKLNRGPGFYWGMVDDLDGNQVELVFIDEGVPDSTFEGFQIGLTVTDQDQAKKYLRQQLGLKELPPFNRPDGSHYFRSRVGASVIKYWTGAASAPVLVGAPTQILGLSMIQLQVSDLGRAKHRLTALGVAVVGEANSATLPGPALQVSGPDGIRFELVEVR